MRALLSNILKTVSERCINCNLCQNECAFLQKYGKPGEIAQAYNPDHPGHLKMPFECNLCGLCAAVCPVDINPGDMFLEMRRESVDRGCERYGADCVYLGYERRGTSRHLSYYALPQGCDTIFFPGCAFPATRPVETFNIFSYLEKKIPALGIVLDCCTKPSHDLGRESYFHAMFGEMRDFLVRNGVESVIVNCPNCYKIFKAYGHNISVKTIYGFLDDNGVPANTIPDEAVTIHDPCVLRFEEPLRDGVRRLLERGGVKVEDMPHHGERTLCCGQGASVGCVDPALSEKWRGLRTGEANGKKIITYCAGCVHWLGKTHPVIHILDLVFAPETAMARKVSPGFPVTCFNRLRLKNRIRQKIPAAIMRERTFQAETMNKPGQMNRNTLAFMVSLIIGKIFMLFQRKI